MVFSDILTAINFTEEKWDDFTDWREGFFDIQELDGYQQKFANLLERVLKSTLRTDIPIDSIIDQFESQREEILGSLKDQKISDVDTAVDRLTDHLIEAISAHVDRYSVEREELEEAIETAYREALDEFLEEIAENHDDRLVSELTRVIQEDLEEFTETLEELKSGLTYESSLLGRYEPFRVAGTDTEIAALIAEELEGDFDQTSYYAPAEFDESQQVETALFYGRKGTGKSRTLYESVANLVDTQDFDQVIYIQSGFRNPRDFGSLAHRNYEGDVLLVWDDAHDPGDSDLIKTVLEQLRGNLETNGGHTLWSRLTARRSLLDNVISSGVDPEELGDRTHETSLTREGEPLKMVAVDGQDGYTRDQLTEIAKEYFEAYDLDATSDGLEEFIDAVESYDPSPGYINSACTQLAKKTDTVTEQAIASLPKTMGDIWKQAYEELRVESLYGDDRRAILKSVALLDWLDADRFDTDLVRSICEEAFIEPVDFKADLEYLETRGWITINPSTNRIQIDDIRLEAIEPRTDDSQVIAGLSRALEAFATGPDEVSKSYVSDYPSTLNLEFATKLDNFETPLDSTTNLIDKHFRIASLTAEASPNIHQQYAEYLESVNRMAAAETHHQIAQEIRPNDDSVRQEFHEFKRRIKEQLDDLHFGPRDDGLIEPSEPDGIDSQDTTSTLRDGASVSPAASEFGPNSAEYPNTPGSQESEDRHHDPRRGDSPVHSTHPRRENAGYVGDYREGQSRCQVCGEKVPPGDELCRVHRKQPHKAPTKDERAEGWAKFEKQTNEKDRELIESIIEKTADADDPAQSDFFRTLWELQCGIDTPHVESLVDPDSLTGMITNVKPIERLETYLENCSEGGSSSESDTPWDSKIYSSVLLEEVESGDSLTSLAPESDDRLPPVVAEVDTGVSRWLTILPPSSLANLLEIDLDNTQEVASLVLDGPSLEERIHRKLQFTYCSLHRFPGSNNDELSLFSINGPDGSIPVTSVRIHETPSETRRPVRHGQTVRVTANELLDATESLSLDRSLSFTGSTLLPTGGRATEVCLCGQLTAVNSIEEFIWWAWLRDPYGNQVPVYTPVETHVPRDSIDTEKPVVVTGTAESDTTEDGEHGVVVSINDITSVSWETSFYWTVETGYQTCERIDSFDTDPGLSQLSRYVYDIGSAADLDSYRDPAASYRDLL